MARAIRISVADGAGLRGNVGDRSRYLGRANLGQPCVGYERQHDDDVPGVHRSSFFLPLRQRRKTLRRGQVWQLWACRIGNVKGFR